MSSFSSVLSRRLTTQICGRRSASTGPHVAVVGAGPAGFYAAQHIAKARPDATVDIYEKLPVPFGLVRFGVAPDHPEVKNCITTFTKTASAPNVNFIGNTVLGKDISLERLRNCYHSVLLTYGAEEDRELGISGESLKNVLAARSLVSYYNGHPELGSLDLSLDTDTVVIVGVGNVALDCARLLLTPIHQLRKFDTTELWLEKLRQSRVRRVILVGRRGPLHVSFTIKELREMLKLPNTRTILHRDQFEPVREKAATVERARKRLTELMIKTALDTPDSATAEKWRTAEREWELRLLRSPVEFLPRAGGDSVEKVVLGINCPEGDGVRSTGEQETVECGLVLRSIGYKAVRHDPGIPFNSADGIVTNTEGRVEAGLYTAGWLATGPRGVIVNTMNTAFKVAANLVQDLDSRLTEPREGRAGMGGLERATSWQDWITIDQHEAKLGEAVGKPREKLLTVQEMLKVLGRD